MDARELVARLPWAHGEAVLALLAGDADRARALLGVRTETPAPRPVLRCAICGAAGCSGTCRQRPAEAMPSFADVPPRYRRCSSCEEARPENWFTGGGSVCRECRKTKGVSDGRAKSLAETERVTS